MDAVHAGGLGGTYGGNPVACAAALGAIETMASEDLRAGAREIEALFLPRLEALAAKYPEIGDIRGRGAMLAVELVTDPDTKTPDPALTAAVNKACHAAGPGHAHRGYVRECAEVPAAAGRSATPWYRRVSTSWTMRSQPRSERRPAMRPSSAVRHAHHG